MNDSPGSPTHKKLFYIHETPSLLFILKPAMVHSVRRGRGPSKSLSAIDCLEKQYLWAKSVRPNTSDGCLCNRLDFSTSGILIAAKSDQIWEKVREQFSHKEIKKKYRCLVDGHLDQPREIQAFLGNRYKNSKKVTVFPPSSNQGILTTSSVTPIEHSQEFHCTLVEVTTSSGARHQVRAHLAHIRHPLSGDKLYGSLSTLENTCPRLLRKDSEQDRMFYLEAFEVEMTDPNQLKGSR